MTRKESHRETGSQLPKRNVIPVSELMKQIEHLTGVRKRINEGYYDRPEVLAEIAEKLSRRLRH